jgi:proteic killer suppression protein
MSVLRAAACLEEVPVGKPDRRHALSLNRKGQFAVDITENYRLIFEPNNNPLPLQKDGGLDLKRITDIKILEVEDYHGD